MQRTENEFDAERRPLGHVIWLTSFPGSSPTCPTEKLNYVGHILSYDLCKVEVLMASYPLALSTEHVSLRAAFTNSLWTVDF